jgi:hypothetical protein
MYVTNIWTGQKGGHAFLFLGLRFFVFSSFLLFAWWPPLLFLVRNYLVTKGRGTKRARVTRGSRNPKHGKGKHKVVSGRRTWARVVANQRINA